MHLTETVMMACLLGHFLVTVAFSVLAPRRASSGLLEGLIAARRMPW